MSSARRITKDTTIQDLLNAPSAYGVPTFDQYRRNPKKYVVDNLRIVEESDTVLKRSLSRQTYEVFGYEVKSLERADEIAKDHGYNLADMQFCPEVESIGAGKINIKVVFKPKNLIETIPGMGNEVKAVK